MDDHSKNVYQKTAVAITAYYCSFKVGLFNNLHFLQ